MKSEFTFTELDNLVERYRDIDYRCGLQQDRLWSNRDYEMSLFIPTKQAKEYEEKVLRELEQEISALPAPDPALKILKSHFTDFIEGQQSNLDGLYD